MDLNSLINHIEESIKFGELEVSKLTHDVITLEGLTSSKVKMFLNNLCNLDGSTYLELGVYKGATFCCAMYQNNIKGIAIDGWKNNLQPNTSTIIGIDKENPQEIFLQNIKAFCSKQDVDTYKASFQDFNFNIIPTPNIIYYDGEVSELEILTSLSNLFKSIQGTFILVVDDWNWTNKHVKTFLNLSQINIHYQKELFTSIEDPNDFWNGLGVFLLEK